ncbi:MAG: DUF4388 domain-containing protein [Candidatus Sericytochromatia bacterium]|nr:DUF4388 domain-containing protein [Candidatus Sericytochromatia bacterium]
MLESGNLKHFNLTDLITILGQSKKTGELSINSNLNKETLYFLNGLLIHAENGELFGEEVVYELMTHESGEFSFIETEVLNNKTIEKDTADLLKEGSLRVELISKLKKSSISIKPNSIIVLKAINIDALTHDEIVLVNTLKNIPEASIVMLAKKINFELGYYIQVLNDLINKNIIQIKKSDEEVLWISFQKVVDKFYLEFTAISGLKMSTDLDKKIQDLILTNTWNLSFKDGRIYTNELFNFPLDEQWKIYQTFLDELFSYFVKVYGNEFIDKTLNNLLDEDPNLKILLEKLKK